MERNGSFAGNIKFTKIRPINRYNFLDYILGGCKARLMFLIDFTAGNGAPDSHGSLHNLSYPGAN